jgi:hypothetical protein
MLHLRQRDDADGVVIVSAVAEVCGAWVEMRSPSARRWAKGKQEGSNRPRFPQFRAQIFRFHAENCVDIDEATV